MSTGSKENLTGVLRACCSCHVGHGARGLVEWLRFTGRFRRYEGNHVANRNYSGYLGDCAEAGVGL